MVKGHKITLKVEVPTDIPNVQSVESIWKTANWHEREAFDFYGITFTGHPDLRRILCTTGKGILSEKIIRFPNTIME